MKTVTTIQGEQVPVSKLHGFCSIKDTVLPRFRIEFFVERDWAEKNLKKLTFTPNRFGEETNLVAIKTTIMLKYNFSAYDYYRLKGIPPCLWPKCYTEEGEKKLNAIRNQTD